VIRTVGVFGTGLGTAAPLAAAALVAFGAGFIVVGGCALVLHEVADSCRDLDIVPEPGAASLVRLCDALCDLGGPRLRPQTVSERGLTSVTTPFGRIDVMFATARREYDSLLAGSSDVRVSSVPVRVAAVADVLRLRIEFGGGDGGE
jgi:hypothetical protein